MNRPLRVWRLVGLLSATASASYLCRVNLSVAGVLLMKEYGFSQVVMGRVFSAFLLGYALFQVPGGMLADRYGARRVLAGAALWWVAATALLALRFLLGVGEAPTFPAVARPARRGLPAGFRDRPASSC